MENKYEELREEIKQKTDLLTPDNLRALGVAAIRTIAEATKSPKMIVQFNNGKEQVLDGLDNILKGISALADNFETNFSDNFVAAKNVYKVQDTFLCDSVAEQADGTRKAKLSSEHTGSIEVTSSQNQQNWFKPGKQYNVNFTEQI